MTKEDKEDIECLAASIIEECHPTYDGSKTFEQQFNAEEIQDLYEELDVMFDFDDFMTVPFQTTPFRSMTLNMLVDHILETEGL